MTSREIRQSFLEFFKSKGHTIVPSSSLLPDSPNLLFTNAGMNQFVPIFLGQIQCPYTPPRAADTQKCIRAGGKHNDLEDVGLDTYHHTFFEMLGNWSFGDYFKKDAIEWAWELVAGVWKFPRHRLYATVYSPGEGEPSQFDQEAHDHWARLFSAAGLDPKVHVVNGGKKDNFWMMGDTGPCGPCSELHVDLSPAGDTKGALVNQGSPQCIEIWNLVFIQFNANPDGTFSPLPARHVDTGMGFERVTGILQCTRNFTDFTSTISNYETDIFRKLFDKLELLSGKQYRSTLPLVQGSATVPVASVGVPPTESARETDRRSAAQLPSHLPESAARDAQQGDRDGRAPQATYYKRRLPHFERPWAKYMVTFSTREHRQLSQDARDVVLKSLLFSHEQRRYQLYAAAVMPDHVHMLFEPQIKEHDIDGKTVFWSLTELLHSIKSFTAHEVNKVENKTGQVWENESFDRLIRGDADLEEKFHYICRNPWDSGVVPATEGYPWLWTPDIQPGSATVPVASAGVPPTESAREADRRSAVQLPSHAPESAARDAQQGDRDGRAPQASEQISIDIAFRVIADHIRTLSFAIADGIQPSNEGRGYVLRRILRRAVRYGRTLGFHEPFFFKLVDVLAETMGDIFPEIRAKQKHLREVMRAEEEAFNKTLDKGIALFNEEVEDLLGSAPVSGAADRVPAAGIGATESQGAKYSRRQAPDVAAATESRSETAKEWLARYPDVSREDAGNSAWDGRAPQISGAFAFRLYDEQGFPLDLTELMARERGLSVDVAGFNKLMEEQKSRARAARKKTVIELSQIESTAPTTFVGYEKLQTPAKVLEVVSLKDKTAVILDTSPCYAEMGGQVGDTGSLVAADASLRLKSPENTVALSQTQLQWRIANTQKHGNTWLHLIDQAADSIGNRQSAMGNPPEDLPAIGSTVLLSVDTSRRRAIERHHTATHLLHWALHEMVSRDASQKGSFVGPDKLTFDFNHAPLTQQQVAEVEKLVNERILENAGVSWIEVPYAEIKPRKDIMQFFGDKYGDVVRVVQIGGLTRALDGYSMELCGGTHTRATGEIGLFRIVGENAIASGVRRIEAIAGLEAYRKAAEELHLIKSLAGKVNAPIGELEKKIEVMLDQQRALEKQLKAAQQKDAAGAAKNLIGKAATINGIPAIIENAGALDGDALQAMVNELKGQFKGVIVLGGVSDGAVTLIASVTSDFTAKTQAGKIIQQIAPIVGGKGGGRPDNARGGGKDISNLDAALAKAKSLL